jgi:cytoskeletal protein RodZ
MKSGSPANTAILLASIMTDKFSTREKQLSIPLPSRWLIYVIVLMIVAGFIGFVGMGSAQQTPNATTNTTTTTGEQDTQMTNGTTTNIETIARSPTPTPDANGEWENAAPIGTDRTANETLPVGDQDWHVFSVESSGRITVRLVAGNRTNMSGFLYDSTGDLLDSTYIAPGEQLSLTGQAASAGDYYVFIRNEANTSGAYAFSVSVAESETAANDVQPQTPPETSSGSGPGFGLLAGLATVVGAGVLLLFRLVRNSMQSE